MTYPTNTYEELAFVGTAVEVPDREVNATMESALDSGALIHANVPALRARLRCRFPLSISTQSTSGSSLSWKTRTTSMLMAPFYPSTRNDETNEAQK